MNTIRPCYSALSGFYLVLFLIASLFIIGTSTAHASLYGQNIEVIDLEDQRTFLPDYYAPPNSEGGLSGSYAGFHLSWLIWETAPSSGIWKYSYTFYAGKDPSNFILELTDENTTLTNINSTDPDMVWEINTFTQSGMAVLPHDIFGIKFELNNINPVTISFETTSDPVWGNFHVKSKADDIQAFNNALGITNFDSNEKLDFVVRPDGIDRISVVPEPLSSLLFVIGGATLGLGRYWKKRKNRLTLSLT